MMDPKRLREWLLRRRPTAAVVVAGGWVLLANMLGFMKAEGWAVVSAISGGYLMGMIVSHAKFAAKSVFLYRRHMFIVEARGWKQVSWLITMAMMLIGLAGALAMAWYHPSTWMVIGAGIGTLAFTKILKPEMVKLDRQLRK